MAKTTVKKPEPAKAPAKKSNVPAVRKEGGTALANLKAKLKEDAGKGISRKQEDNVVPLVRVLQSLSPQLKAKKPEYIPGAKVGDFELRGLPEPLIDGEEGFEFQPCAFSKDVIEWRPRDSGGGFVRRWKDMPKDAEEELDDETGRVTYKHGTNELIDTRYHAGFAIIDGIAYPYIIPFKSTGHQVSRDWTTRMNARRIDGEIAPAWMFTYWIKTKEKSNASGDWAVIDIQNHSEISTEEEYERGKAMWQAFDDQSDKRTLEAEIEERSESSGPSGGGGRGSRSKDDAAM